MKVSKFEDLIAWQKAQDLAVVIYSSFDYNKDFSFKNQICSAVISVSNNIAEGFDRSSDADFSRFLYISISSCSEVKSMLYLAQKLGYINEESRNRLIEDANEVSRIIRGLIKSLIPKK
ncbi:MAG TPA: four helix bundle protein [Chitinophagales bacterium]|nr:four helix bundle protein [Chitinophagales bacterium]